MGWVAKKARLSFGKKIALGALVFLATGALALALWLGPAVRAFWKEGFFEKETKRVYVGNTLDNLKALHTALMLYHESEGAFPVADAWMEAAKLRVKTSDLTEEEAIKKFKRPGVPKNGFGYALNEACSKKYRGDLDPKAVLVFESIETKWNATGDPRKDFAPLAKGITIDGSLVDVDTKGQKIGATFLLEPLS